MDRTTENDTDEWSSPLVDVSDMSLEDLTSRHPDGALAASLRRLAAERDEPDEPIAGFNSAL